jgi:hypothetical protein
MSAGRARREVGVLHALGCSRAQIGARVFRRGVVHRRRRRSVRPGRSAGVGLAWFLLRKASRRWASASTCEPQDDRAVRGAVARGRAAGRRGRRDRAGRLDLSAVRAREHRRGGWRCAARTLARGSPGRAGFQWLAAALLALVMPAIYFGVVPVIGEQQTELVGVILLGLGVLACSSRCRWSLRAPRVRVRRLAKPFERLWPLAGKLAARTCAGPGPHRRRCRRNRARHRGLRRVARHDPQPRGRDRRVEPEAFRDKRLRAQHADAQLRRRSRRTCTASGSARRRAQRRAHLRRRSCDRRRRRSSPGTARARTIPSCLAALRDGKGMIVSRRLAKHRDYAVGDSSHMRAPCGGRVESFPRGRDQRRLRLLPAIPTSACTASGRGPRQRPGPGDRARPAGRLRTAPAPARALVAPRDRGGRRRRLGPGVRALSPLAHGPLESGPGRSLGLRRGGLGERLPRSPLLGSRGPRGRGPGAPQHLRVSRGADRVCRPQAGM